MSERKSVADVLKAAYGHAAFKGRNRAVFVTYAALVTHADWSSGRKLTNGRTTRAGEVLAGLVWLAEKCDISQTTAGKHVKHLVRHGLLVLWSESRGDARRARCYLVTEMAEESSLAEAKAMAERRKLGRVRRVSHPGLGQARPRGADGRFQQVAPHAKVKWTPSPNPSETPSPNPSEHPTNPGDLNPGDLNPGDQSMVARFAERPGAVWWSDLLCDAFKACGMDLPRGYAVRAAHVIEEAQEEEPTLIDAEGIARLALEHVADRVNLSDALTNAACTWLYIDRAEYWRIAEEHQ